MKDKTLETINKKQRRTKMKNKGFTLIELILVIAILGILSAVALPRLANLSEIADDRAADQMRVETIGALNNYGNEQLARTGYRAYYDNSLAGLDDSLFEDDGGTLSYTPADSTFKYFNGKRIHTWTYTSDGETYDISNITRTTP
jgi:prepilin-type N-terminal cleavage/methylation domain-containing protein